MDQAEEVTAEFKTEEIKQEAAVLSTPEPTSEKSDPKGWIPVAIGLITLAVMVTIAVRFWLAA